MRLTCPAILVTLGSGPCAAFAQPDGVIGYDCIDLGILPGDDDSSAYAISDDGWITVQSVNRPALVTACVWVNGRLIVLPVPDGYEDPRLSAGGISPSGYIVGSVEAGERYPIVWVSGQGIFLPNLLPGAVEGSAADINDNGWFVGECGNPFTASVWRGTLTPTRIGDAYSYATQINAFGEAAGSAENAQGIRRPALWLADGTQIDIGGEPLDAYGYATDINDWREVVGYLEGFGAVLWREGVLMPIVGTCSGFASISGINNDGWIVGTAASSKDCFANSVCLWHLNGPVFELATMPLKGLPAEPFGTKGVDINDAGQLAVDVEESEDVYRGYLFTPYNFNLSNPVPGIAGQVNTITVTGLQPGQKVRLAAGFKPGAQRLPNSGCLGGLLLIQNLKGVLPPATADNAGTATFVVNVPASLRGQTLRLQAFDKDNCEISHSVDWTFQ